MVPEERALKRSIMNLKKWFETIHELQGDCLIFSTEGTSIRWIGNERGYAGDPLWQKVKPDQLGTEAELDYLQHGDPSGTIFQSERQMFHPARLVLP